MNNTYAPTLPRHPAFLYIGTPEITEKKCFEYLYAALCSRNACHQCITCLGITNRNHSRIFWLSPEKNYKREDIEIVFDITQFKQPENEPIFIICMKAETLTTSCSNSMLKLLEEPPAGYQFILLSDSLETILPTIRSRCLITVYTDSSSAIVHPFVTLCLRIHEPSGAVDIHDYIEQAAVAESDTELILAQLLAEYKKRYVLFCKNSNPLEAKRTIDIMAKVEHLLEKPIMPGSSKLFLRNLALHLLSSGI